MSPAKKSIAAALSLPLLFTLAIPAAAQTFRGGINGTVTDATGAVTPGARIIATEESTGIVHATLVTSAGDFNFADLPLGQYTLTVTAAGFATEKVEHVPVSSGSVYTQPVHLSVAGTSTEVSVSASQLALDTTSSTQTTVIDSKAVNSVPLNGGDFTQLAALTPGFAGYSAGGTGSLNGTRFDQINWQIEGIDNNDIWANIPAVNQGGVLGIAGILLPIDSIDQFSVQTEASPEAGRNPGGVVNVGLRSGANQLHGSAYYFNRNEAYAAGSPFLPFGQAKLKNRNYNAGGSLGAPIMRDRFFFFGSFETQHFTIGQSGQATEPSAAYQALSTSLLARYGVAPDPVSRNLLQTLWPSYSLNGPGTGENYFSTNPEFGHSYNGLVKLDYALNSKNNLSFHWFSGEGNQTAPVGSSLLYYYEVAPIHVQNYALVLDTLLSPRINNQIEIGVNYFNQIFNDNKKNFDLAATGFFSGSQYPTVAPHLRISGFDAVGIVAPSGRNDIVGQINDTVAISKGTHDFRFGGEYRQAQIDAFNSGNSTGLFRFTGSAGPWAHDATVTDNNVKSLADFLAGYVNTSTLATGDPDRQVFINIFDLFAQDSWRLTQRFTLNYGVRYDYEGPPHDALKNLSIFRPGAGFLFQGAGIGSVYPSDWNNFGPRVGFSWQPSGTAVLRGGVGLYYDQPVTSAFLNNHTSNSSPIGLQANPAGPQPFLTQTRSAYTITAGQQIFPSAAQASCTETRPCGAFTVSPNFATPYVVNYNLNVQQTLGTKVIAQIGYVGNESRKLLGTRDINQSALLPFGSPANNAQILIQQESRPFFSTYPTLGNINQLGTLATGNYSSLQATLRLANLHGITSQINYTWSHSLDEVSQSRSLLPQNSADFQGDYGNSALDTRNTFTAYVTYTLPDSGHGPKRLTNGWQFNSLINLNTGQPFTIYNGSDTTGTDENAQRVNMIGNPFAGVSHHFQRATATNGGAGEPWINPAAFVSPPNGTFGTMRRNQLFGPNFSDVDLSVFKNTPLTERFNFQLRVEMFNIFNRINLAPPNNTLGSGFGQLYDTIGDNYGAPGIGPGEPFNIQLGGKITF